MTSQKQWRGLLDNIISDPQERGKIANALGINQATLIRWAKDETNPRPQNLSALVRNINSAHSAQMTELIKQEFPGFVADGGPVDDIERIPSDFYASIIAALGTTQHDQRFFTISNRVFKQALAQLDTNTLGMALSIAKCMPPAPGKKVRSLREVAGRGTSPWQPTLEQEALFLGIESLAGYALTKGRAYVAVNRSERLGFYAIRWEEWEESAVACPIMLEGRYAGCLIASSTQPGYFLPFRQDLLEQYAGLVALAFDPEDFYDHQSIELLPMPAREVQHERAVDVQQRLSQRIHSASSEGRAIDIEQEERLVWQQVEEELLTSLVQTTSREH
jgi:hypothetical protein